MNRQRFETATAFLLQHGSIEKIRVRERYKISGAQAVRRHLEAFQAGDPTSVDLNPNNVLDILDWRVIKALNLMAAARPEIFRAALSIIWATPLNPKNADAFWTALEPAVDAIDHEWSKALNGLGTRASIASFFLFAADPQRFPFFRPHYGGKAIEYLYGRTEGLDQTSPAALLHDYGMRCAYLYRELRDAG